jgi:hypothetical protein
MGGNAAGAGDVRAQLQQGGIQLHVGNVSWQVLPAGSFFSRTGAARVSPLFDMHHLAQIAHPSHPSAQANALDLGAFLYNPESSLGVDSSLFALKNRDELQLLPQLPMRAYFGLLHSHTFDSDGLGSPETAFKMARDAAQLDFFAVTDHSEYWFSDADDTWDKQKAIALKESGDLFVGLVGFEYSHTLFGHMVVLNSDSWTNAYRQPTWSGFMDWLAQPAQRSSLAVFAHPGFHAYRNWFDLSHFKFDARLREKIFGVEMIQKNVWRRSMKGYSGASSFLEEAAQSGWNVGPVASQDNHTEYWGVADGSRLALLLPALNRETLHDALRARRFYATQSPQLQLSLGVYDRADRRVATIGDELDARAWEGQQALLRVRIYEPNPIHRLCRLDVMVNDAVEKSVHFLDNASGAFFESGDSEPAASDRNCGPRTPPQPWWERLMNNGWVTGRPFAWVFEPRPANVSEVFDFTVPLSFGGCSRLRGELRGGGNTRVVIRLLQGFEGEKLTLTSPVTFRCGDFAGGKE